MAAFSTSPGSSTRGGWGYEAVTTVGLLADPGPRLSLHEAFGQGVGKAHRQVVYAHHDLRNFDRGAKGPRAARVR